MVPVLAEKRKLYTATSAVLARIIRLHHAGICHSGCGTNADDECVIGTGRQLQSSDVLEPDNHAQGHDGNGLRGAALEGKCRGLKRWRLVKEDDAVACEDGYNFAPLPLLPRRGRGCIGLQGDLHTVLTDYNRFPPAHLQERLHRLPLLC